MITFLLLNILFYLLLLGLLVSLFEDFKNNPNHHHSLDFKIKWLTMISIAGILFITSIFLFIRTANNNPGYTKKIPYNDFCRYLDWALKEKRNIEYFCFFCRCLWSYSGVHCQICERCVEGYDHHCNFVNNCIGFQNHSTFLSFLITFTTYVFIMISL